MDLGENLSFNEIPTKIAQCDFAKRLLEPRELCLGCYSCFDHVSVPFDYCERPPSISHGFMSTPPESVYRILFEVIYECHPGKPFRVCCCNLAYYNGTNTKQKLFIGKYYKLILTSFLEVEKNYKGKFASIKSISGNHLNAEPSVLFSNSENELIHEGAKLFPPKLLYI